MSRRCETRWPRRSRIRAGGHAALERLQVVLRRVDGRLAVLIARVDDLKQRRERPRVAVLFAQVVDYEDVDPGENGDACRRRVVVASAHRVEHCKRRRHAHGVARFEEGLRERACLVGLSRPHAADDVEPLVPGAAEPDDVPCRLRHADLGGHVASRDPAALEPALGFHPLRLRFCLSGLFALGDCALALAFLVGDPGDSARAPDEALLLVRLAAMRAADFNSGVVAYAPRIGFFPRVKPESVFLVHRSLLYSK